MASAVILINYARFQFQVPVPCIGTIGKSILLGIVSSFDYKYIWYIDNSSFGAVL
jgi:hypothetical protein